jgi:hypothetical protein
MAKQNEHNELQQYEKYRVKTKFRTEYNGRLIKYHLKDQNGIELIVMAIWLQDERDPYPGEWAMATMNDGRFGEFLRKHNVRWVSSGDLEIIEAIRR